MACADACRGYLRGRRKDKLLRTPLAVVLSFVASCSSGDGKVYSESVPADIPYQRAVLTFDGIEQVLLLESKFVAAAGERFGWVVPVPALPKIEAPRSSDVDLLYRRLEDRTRPVRVNTFEVILTMGLLVLVVAFPYKVYLLIARGREFGWVLPAVVVACILATVKLPADLEVQVLAEERVGSYEAKVLRAGSPEELVSWLKQGGFAFSERDLAVFAAYIQRGWLFVTAQLQRGAKGEKNGMIPPLFLRFPTQEATYPLALTGSSGHDTEVLLYVFAPARVDSSDRLPLRYSNEWDGMPPFSDSLNWKGPVYITKFRGRLTPSQMASDLSLQYAASNRSFRSWEFRP